MAHKASLGTCDSVDMLAGDTHNIIVINTLLVYSNLIPFLINSPFSLNVKALRD